MESSGEKAIAKLRVDELKHEPPHRQQELGSGFQSSASVECDPNVKPPLPPFDDLDELRTNEELQNERAADHAVHDDKTLENEAQNLKPIDVELRDGKAVDEELQYQRTICEDIKNLVLQEGESASKEDVDREGNTEVAEVEANKRDAGHEECWEEEKDIREDKLANDVYAGDRDEIEDAKGDEGFEEGNNDDNLIEDGEEDDNADDGARGEAAVFTGSKNGRYRRSPYPVRPDAEDCVYYMRHGTCKFGSHCKFNHPPRRKNQATKDKRKEENPERLGQTECKYYLKSGGCKYGNACKYNHSGGKTPITPIVQFNFLGLPIRLEEKDCPYYMRNGSCKYGFNCRFNHPDPSTQGGDPHSGYGANGSVSLQGVSQPTMSSWSSPRALSETGPLPMMFSPTQVSSTSSEWNGYQASVYPTAERSLPIPPAFALNNPMAESTFHMYHIQQIVPDEYPERPGEPECSYFMKTGHCRYRSGCKFHHPKNRIPKTTTCALSEKGLPLRPDRPICMYYSRYGICKYGPACKFDHPVNYSQSASLSVSRPDTPFGNSSMTDDARTNPSENGIEAQMQPSF